MLACLLRLGAVADLLSRPVLIGYMAGLAAIMIADQLERVTGVPVSGQSFINQLTSFTQHIGAVRPGTLILTAGLLAFLFLLRWRWPQAPASLLALVIATGAVALFGLTSQGIALVGHIPAGVAVPAVPDRSSPAGSA